MRNLIISFVLVFSCGIQINAQWNLISEYDTSIVLHDVYFHNDDTGFVVGRKYMDFIPAYPPFNQYVDSLLENPNGMLMKTVDGGISWDTLFYPSFIELNSICFPTHDTGYIVGESPAPDIFILKTIDGGNTWLEINCNVCYWSGIHFSKVFFLNPDIGFATGPSELLQKTSNGGLTWNICGNCEHGTDIDFPSDSIGYLSYGWKTIDAGNNWIDIYASFPPFNSTLAVGFHNDISGYLAGNFSTGYVNLGKIACTNNGGQSWNEFLLDSLGDIKDIFIQNENEAYFVGGNIIKTTDQGNNYYLQTIADDLFGFLFSIFFPSPKIGYAVGAGGEILKTINDGGGQMPVSILTIADKPQNQKGVNVYPVPANNQLNISVSEGVFDGFEIYSQSGQLLQKTKSKNSLEQLDISNLPSGNYFIRAIRKDEVFVRKFVVVR